MADEISENEIMPFGKYKGEKLANVPASTLLYYYNQDIVTYGPVYKYIYQNYGDLCVLAKRE